MVFFFFTNKLITYFYMITHHNYHASLSEFFFLNSDPTFVEPLISVKPEKMSRNFDNVLFVSPQVVNHTTINTAHSTT